MKWANKKCNNFNIYNVVFLLKKQVIIILHLYT